MPAPNIVEAILSGWTDQRAMLQTLERPEETPHVERPGTVRVPLRRPGLPVRGVQPIASAEGAATRLVIGVLEP
jgi:hypothetical protein